MICTRQVQATEKWLKTPSGDEGGFEPIRGSGKSPGAISSVAFFAATRRVEGMEPEIILPPPP